MSGRLTSRFWHRIWGALPPAPPEDRMPAQDPARSGGGLGSPRYEPVDGVAPYWGEWGVVGEPAGTFSACGKVGPFPTVEEAFRAAGEAASAHGAREMPLGGFAQVRDARGRPVGPVI